MMDADTRAQLNDDELREAIQAICAPLPVARELRDRILDHIDALLAERDRLAAERDKLRDLVSHARELFEDCAPWTIGPDSHPASWHREVKEWLTDAVPALLPDAPEGDKHDGQ